MANPLTKAFNLALAGDAAALESLLKTVGASAAREDGMCALC